VFSLLHYLFLFESSFQGAIYYEPWRFSFAFWRINIRISAWTPCNLSLDSFPHTN
jgi:hypothetical protein